MSSSFMIGDVVVFLNEKLEGKVVGFKPNGQLEVETEDGFVYPVLSNDIVKKVDWLQENNSEKKNKPSKVDRALRRSIEKLDKTDWDKIQKEKEEKQRAFHVSTPKSKNRTEVHDEIDIHIEKLTSRWKYLSNAEIIEIQLNATENAMNKAAQDGLHTLTVIHGVGTGRLRNEVRKLADLYGKRYEDAIFSFYGVGATTIYLR